MRKKASELNGMVFEILDGINIHGPVMKRMYQLLKKQDRALLIYRESFDEDQYHERPIRITTNDGMRISLSCYTTDQIKHTRKIVPLKDLYTFELAGNEISE